MRKKIFSIKSLIAAFVACLSLACAFAFGPNVTASAEANGNYETEINGVESFSGSPSVMVFYLEECDYMTADEWGRDNYEAYKWYSGELPYSQKSQYNMPNALLNKHLNEYNFAENIFIDGVALKNFSYNLVANQFTRVNGLGIMLTDGKTFEGVENITFNEGCTIPTLEYGYFGEGEFTAITLKKAAAFRFKNGSWMQIDATPFDGYEKGTEYDASSRYCFLYGKTVYKGHPTAPTNSYTTVLEGYGWDDTGYAISTDTSTVKGNLMIFDLVNPIDSREFGLLTIRLYANVARSYSVYNASGVTEDSLGEIVDIFSVAGGFVTLPLLTPLYADENGMVETVVLQFNDNGHQEAYQNQVYFTSFTLGDNTINTTVYDESFTIRDMEEDYGLVFRFNKNGEFNGDEELQTEKVIINGVRLSDVLAEDKGVSAKWASVGGYYQINVTMPKAYDGEAKIKNPDLSYDGNKMSVEQGFAFPNGETLDRTYTCNVYASEVFVTYEFMKEYKETKLLSISWKIDPTATDNIHLCLKFNQDLATQPYYHACNSEGWRETALFDAGLYDGALSQVFVAGGYKAALLDNIVINGKSLGTLHAEDTYPTCVFTHFMQTGSDTIDLCVDSRSDIYAWLLPLFESGEGVEITVKEGMKFSTGYKTSEDVKFTLKNGKFETELGAVDFKVFYDGKAVEDGAALTSNTAATENAVYVQGVKGYTLTQEKSGDTVTFTVTYGEKTVSFSVREELTPLPEPTVEEEKPGFELPFGCGASLAGGFTVGSGLLLALGSVLMRRKNDEE